jgi:hypothetical protein
MSSEIINQLQVLQPNSGKQLNSVVVTKIQDPSKPLALVKRRLISHGNWATQPRNGAASLANPENMRSVRQVRVLAAGQEENTTYALNTELLGGANYPVLSAVLGTVAGMVGVGLIFTVATTGLSLTKTSHRVLARAGDEVWHVEEIGKIKDGAEYKPMYVSSFFIVDPYRRQAQSKGWLIHEERREIDLS